MKLTDDPCFNIAYIGLRAKTEQVELLNANEQLRGGASGALIVIDAASGQRHATLLG